MISAIVWASLHACAFAAKPSPKTPPPAPISLISIEGGELLGADGPVAPGHNLPPGMPLRLTSGAKAVFSSPGLGKMMIHGPAAFAARAKGDTGLDLKAGGALVSLLPGKPARVFSVGTPWTVATILEGAAFVEVRGPRSTYLCVCGGRVDLLGRGERSKVPVESLGAHKAAVFNMSAGHSVQASAPIERHTDEDVAELRR